MPHYADGTEAKVGDQVVGKLYNTEGKRAGTVVSITPGAESCNAQVAFAVPVAIDGDPASAWRDLETSWVLGSPLSSKVPGTAVWRDRPGGRQPLFRVSLGEQHGSSGAAFALFECVDYCATNELTKVGP